MKNINIEVAKDFWEDVLVGKYSKEIKQKELDSIINTINEFWDKHDKNLNAIYEYRSFIDESYQTAEAVWIIGNELEGEKTTFNELDKNSKEKINLLISFYNLEFENDKELGEEIGEIADQAKEDVIQCGHDLDNLYNDFDLFFYKYIIDDLQNIILDEKENFLNKNEIQDNLNSLWEKIRLYDDRKNINLDNFVDEVWNDINKIEN